MNKEEYIKRVSMFCEKHGLATSDFYVGHEDGLLLVGAVDEVDHITLIITNKEIFKKIGKLKEYRYVSVLLENYYWDEKNKIKIDRSFIIPDHCVKDESTGLFRSTCKYLFDVEYIKLNHLDELNEEDCLILLKTLTNCQNKGNTYARQN